MITQYSCPMFQLSGNFSDATFVPTEFLHIFCKNALTIEREFLRCRRDLVSRNISIILRTVRMACLLISIQLIENSGSFPGAFILLYIGKTMSNNEYWQFSKCGTTIYSKQKARFDQFHTIYRMSYSAIWNVKLDAWF